MKTIISFFILLCSLNSFAQIIKPYTPFLAFSDITSGPCTGNSDTSWSGSGNQNGAYVTIWGKFRPLSLIPTPKFYVGNIQAKIIQNSFSSPAANPLEMVTIQIPNGLTNGPNFIYAVGSIGNDTSNYLPFTIRSGNIYYVKTDGNDTSGDGSWTNPWRTLDNKMNTGCLNKIDTGDIVYLCDGVNEIDSAGDHGCVDLGNPGTETAPKAIIGYPFAHASIGDSLSEKSYVLWVSGIGLTSHFVISKLHLTARYEAATMHTGFRVVGNKITAPKGDGPTGAVAGLGNHLYLLGNEITNVGFVGTSKLYHPIYLQSMEACSGPRLPAETDREIAFNNLHDNLSYDGINIYRECGSSAYMTNTRVHHNIVQNQTGCGIRIGDYVVGENWVYNNLIINAGLGPNPPGDQAMHVPLYIHAGWDDTSTLIHCYNNTIVGGGFTGGASWASSMIGFAYNHPMDLDFRNNIIVSTTNGIEYINNYLDTPKNGSMRNLWYGAGVNSPSWDSIGIFGDPLFGGNGHQFSLSMGSPAINTGIPSVQNANYPIPIYDFECFYLSNSAIPDLGALEFDLSKIMAVEKLETLPKFTIYPNPANAILYLDFKEILESNLQLQMTDITGRIVFEKNIIAATKIIQIDVSNLNKGLYIVTIGRNSKKIIVE
jgi:hypothetical protein